MKIYGVIQIGTSYSMGKLQFEVTVTYEGHGYYGDQTFYGYGDTLEKAIESLSHNMGTPENFDKER